MRNPQAEWLELVTAAGFPNPTDFNELELFYLSERICNDGVVAERTRTHFILGLGLSVLPENAYLLTVNSMPDAERAALRERIS